MEMRRKKSGEGRYNFIDLESRPSRPRVLFFLCWRSKDYRRFIRLWTNEIVTEWRTKGLEKYGKSVLQCMRTPRYNRDDIKLTRLTPSGSWYYQAGYHFLAYDWRIGRWRRTHQTFDDVIGDSHDSGKIRWLGSRGSHHHTETDFFLKNAFQIHHIQVTYYRTVDHHDLVALNNAWKYYVIEWCER